MSADTDLGERTRSLVLAHRNPIHVESAEVLSNDALAGAQHVMRLRAPAVAGDAAPGSFIHLRCSEELLMRRPMSIMRADRAAGSIDLLYKAVGEGTRRLARRTPGDRLSVVGPVGRPFGPSPAWPRPLLIGGGVGIPPMIFLAETLRSERTFSPLVLMGSEVPFPFPVHPSEILVPGMPPEAIGCMPLLDDWGIPSRLASGQGYAGCFDGLVTELARSWLTSLDAATRSEVEIFACGPTPMLEATARLADALEVPAQVCLEEFMACAVGGCAGCAVRIATPDGPAMKRVCVDGPVFDAASVIWSRNV